MRYGLAVVLAFLLAGCGLADVDIAYEYSGSSGEDQINQTIDVENRGKTSVAPELEITPLDKDGKEIDGLEVNTAFGIDEGRRVVPAGAVAYDVLQFEGSRERDVEDVEVVVMGAEEVELPKDAQDPEVLRYGRGGKPAEEYGDYFETFAIENEYDAPIAVRVVLIEYEDPPEGETQQFVRVTPLVDGLVRIGAGERSEHTLAPDLRGRVGSVKAFLSR